MEKELPKYESPLPVRPIPTVQASRYVDEDTALRATKYRPTAIFFTAVVTAAVLAGGMMGAAVILTGIRTEDCQSPTTATSSGHKLLDADKTIEEDLRKSDGHLLVEGISYDYESNTVLITSPGNLSGSSAATYAVDFDREVVFVSIHGKNICIGFELDQGMASIVAKTFAQDKGNIVDLSTVAVETRSYELVGEIPQSYIQTSNGAIVQGLCSGRPTYWGLLRRADELDERLKRDWCTFSWCWWCNPWNCSWIRMFDCPLEHIL